MKTQAPSPRLLRQLSAICADSRPTTTRLSSRTVCTATRRPSSKRDTVLSRRMSPSFIRKKLFSSTSQCQLQSITTTSPTSPDIRSYYTIFSQTLPNGPPPTGAFDIPLPELRREFLHLQSQYHPDKSPSQINQSLSRSHPNPRSLSTLINAAYNTLSDPLLRAQYLLQHSYSIDVTTEDNSSHPTDPSTLMEVMDAQESIEAAHNEAEIQNLRAQNAIRIEETTTKLGQAFERGDVEGAKNECVRLKYWRSLQDGLKEWEAGKEVRLIH